jgi:hypothetical protein
VTHLLVQLQRAGSHHTQKMELQQGARRGKADAYSGRMMWREWKAGSARDVDSVERAGGKRQVCALLAKVRYFTFYASELF